MADPLLSCLDFLGQVHHRPVNRASATAGLPLVNGQLTPRLFLRAAKRFGLSARVEKQSPADLSPSQLPAVLILDDDRAVVVTKLHDSSATISDPEADGDGDGATIEMPRTELEGQYTGYAILVRPAFAFEDRVQRLIAKRPESWFWGTLWQFRPFYTKVIITSMVINLFALTSSLFIMNVYDRVVPNAAFETLFFLATGAAIVYGFDFLLKMLRSFFVDRAGQRADLQLSNALYEKILGVKFAAKPASSGAFASQARGYESLREFFTSATLVALVDLPFVLFFAVIIYLLGGPVAAPLVIGLLLALGIGFLMQGPLSRSVQRGYLAVNQRHALLVETINNLETIKGNCAESQLQGRMDTCVQESSDAEVGTRWFGAISTNLTALVQQLVSIAIVVIGVFQISNGNMSMGALIACVILGGRGMAPLAQVASLLTRLQQSRTSLEGLNKIMEMPGEREEGRTPLQQQNFAPTIRSEKLEFRYHPEGAPVLKNLDLKIEAGERIAILGRIGSGKSTLLKMLTGLYEPTQGSLSISGREIRQLDAAELRRHAGYVPQQVSLLYGTIADNLRMGLPNATDAEIQQAADLAGVSRFTGNHPDGLLLPVGERGDLLSGGQRQAVCLARALVHRPNLLLLDEPSSAMDQNSEAELVQNLKTYLDETKATFVLSTHMPALLLLVDRIMVLNNGEIAVDGPRDAVLQQLRGPQKQPPHATGNSNAT